MRRKLARSISIGIAVALVATSTALLVVVGETVPLGLPRASGVVVSASVSWVRDAVHDIWRFGGHGPIFVGAPSHDRLVYNAPALYFLSSRPSGTYYHDLIPGVATKRTVQDRIIAELERSKVRTVVIWKSGLSYEPNKSSESSGVFTLDHYLRGTFSTARQTSEYEILVKQDIWEQEREASRSD